MNVQELADLGVSNQIVASTDLTELTVALDRILAENGCTTFKSYAIVCGGKSSTLVFLQEDEDLDAGYVAFFSDSIGVAQELICFADKTARYPDPPDSTRKKGWIIRSVTINDKPAAVAEAAWV